MRRAFAIVALGVLAVLATAQRHPGPDDQGHPPLMRKVFEMRKTVKLSGVRVVQYLEQGERRLVTERIVRDGVNVRTEVADGRNKGQIAVENDKVRRVYSPRENVIREKPAREAEFANRFGKMGGRPPHGPPQFVETDGGRIAGVATRLLEFKLASGQVFSRSWIDPEHGVVLKNQTFDSSGKLNGSFEYTSVKFETSVRPSSFQINKPDAKIVTPDDDLRSMAREIGVKPFRLPVSSGWTLGSVRQMEVNGAKVLMQFYRNQRSRISLFVIKGPLDGERLKRMQEGGINSYVWDIGSVHLALIGEVPTEDLRRLADQTGS